MCFFFGYGDHRELTVSTHSVPTRRDSDLEWRSQRSLILRVDEKAARRDRPRRRCLIGRGYELDLSGLRIGRRRQVGWREQDRTHRFPVARRLTAPRGVVRPSERSGGRIAVPAARTGFSTEPIVSRCSMPPRWGQLLDWPTPSPLSHAPNGRKTDLTPSAISASAG